MSNLKKNIRNGLPVEQAEKDMWDIGQGLIDTQEGGELMHENRRGFTLRAEEFGDLTPYVENVDITDIDFNGTDLWLTDIYNRHWKDTTNQFSSAFIRKLAQNIANSQSIEFNQKNPSLEAETDDLRISVIHNSIAQTGTTMCIRKTPTIERISERYALVSGCFKAIPSAARI